MSVVPAWNCLWLSCLDCMNLSSTYPDLGSPLGVPFLFSDSKKCAALEITCLIPPCSSKNSNGLKQIIRKTISCLTKIKDTSNQNVRFECLFSFLLWVRYRPLTRPWPPLTRPWPPILKVYFGLVWQNQKSYRKNSKRGPDLHGIR